MNNYRVTTRYLVVADDSTKAMDKALDALLLLKIEHANVLVENISPDAQETQFSREIELEYRKCKLN